MRTIASAYLWKVMKEIGIDLGRKVPKAVQELAGGSVRLRDFAR